MVLPAMRNLLRVGGIRLDFSPKTTVFEHSFAAVAASAKSLPVTTIPKQFSISFMGNNVIHHSGRYECAVPLLTGYTPWMLF